MSTIDEKAAADETRPARRRALFRRGKQPLSAAKSEAPLGTATLEVPNIKHEPPVSFTSLFRFATRLEITMNIIGLFFAAGAGSAQPLMTLLFGDLTNDFVAFQVAVNNLNPNNPVSEVAFRVAQAHFKSNAASDAAGVAYIGAGMFFATFVYMYIWVYTSESIAKRVRERYLQAVLRQDIAFFDNVGAGEVATRIQTDTHLVQMSISEKVALIVVYISSFLTGFILAYLRNWRLALAMTSIMPCIATTGAFMNRFVSRYKQSSLRNIAEGGSLAEEVISTVRTAQAFGTQEQLANLYDRYMDRAAAVEYKAAVWQGSSMAIFYFIMYSAYGLAFSFGTTLINEGHATAGEVVNVFMAILIGSISLVFLAPQMQNIVHGRGAAAKLFATIDRVPAIDSADPSGLRPDTVHGAIELDHVDFSYPSRPGVPVAQDLCLSFPAGKTCALVGASGSGKSTVVSLVERFYDPIKGTVRLDGVDVRDLNLKWLRSNIGLVSQEPTLFATTIRGNVAHGLINTGLEGKSEEEQFALIKEACIKANADGFISNLPQGYDTMVGERGFLLSGGQKQRIAIARAIVSDPRILLLDEATSALDTESEGVVQNALDKAAAGRTTITIAHRLSTIRDADCIFVMGNGIVLEQGTHHELLSNPNGAYSQLVTAQKLRETQQRQQQRLLGLQETETDVDGEVVTLADEDVQKAAQAELPLGRSKTMQSLASDILKTKNEQAPEEEDLSLTKLFYRLAQVNRAVWRNYSLAIVAAICTGAIYPSLGIVYAKGINGFIETDRHKRKEDGNRTALYYFIISILAVFAVGTQQYLFGAAAAQMTSKLRKLSFRAILRQDIEFFDREENSTGALVSGLSDNPQKVSGLAGTTLGAIFQAFSTVIIGTIFGLVFAWKVGLVGLGCTPLLLTTGFIRLHVVVLKDQKNKRAHAASAQIACEAAGAIRTVASLTREEDCTRIYSESLEGPRQVSNRSALPSNILYGLSQSLQFFVIALVFWFGSTLVASREFSTFQFYIGLMSTTFSATQAGNIFSWAPDISSAKGAGSAIIRLLKATPDIDAESPEGKKPENVVGQVVFRDVHFRYPTRPGVRVLRGLNLTIQPGQYVALVGGSGCGKSTTIQLIERFYDPLAGGVYLDGQNITELNIQEYRKHIALVSQEPTLYAGTVKFNILLGATKPESEVTQDELEDACRKANILEFVLSLPDGFDTQVGGKGSQLSGGQKQRIAIARALLRNPKVLLLDEATSALDSTSEKVVQQALDQAAKGRTTIAIAHRLSTIQNADCIYFIQDGTVLESGTHDQLIEQRGAYYQYVQLQTISST